MFRATGSRSKVEPWSDHDVAQLDHGRNICAKFKLLHRDLARTKAYVIFIRIFMFKVTGSRSKVEPWSDHDIAQLHHGRKLCAKFELLPAYGHRYLARTKWQLPPAQPPIRPGRMKTMNGCGVKKLTALSLSL